MVPPFPVNNALPWMRPCPTGAALSPPDLTVDPFHRLSIASGGGPDPTQAHVGISRQTMGGRFMSLRLLVVDDGAILVTDRARHLWPPRGERESARGLATHPETTILEAPRNGPRRLVRLLVGAWRRVMQARGLGGRMQCDELGGLLHDGKQFVVGVVHLSGEDGGRYRNFCRG